jgi:hypothetical protein
MSDREKTKWASFTAIATLAGLLIIIVNAHALFSELMFYGLVLTVMTIIVIVFVYAFLGERTARYVRGKMMKRERNRLSRAYFMEFSSLIDRFIPFADFGSIDRGTPRVLDSLRRSAQGVEVRLIQSRIQIGAQILQSPISDFDERLCYLDECAGWNHWEDINYELLSNLAKEFENYVRLHKTLYIDFIVEMARDIGLDRVAQPAKRAYSEYRDDYNQFIISYTDFAKKTSSSARGFQVFDQNLQKASEL